MPWTDHLTDQTVQFKKQSKLDDRERERERERREFQYTTSKEYSTWTWTWTLLNATMNELTTDL